MTSGRSGWGQPTRVHTQTCLPTRGRDIRRSMHEHTFPPACYKQACGAPGSLVRRCRPFHFLRVNPLRPVDFTAFDRTRYVGLDRHVAEPGTLVVLPAGVPHRQWNEGRVPERHLALLSPAPEPGRPLDVGVKLEATGEVYG